MKNVTFTIKPSPDKTISLPQSLLDKAKDMGLLGEDDTMTITDLRLLLGD